MLDASALVAAVSLAVVVSCSSAPATTPSGARASCAADADCVVTTSGGCCSCCPSEPHAIPTLVQTQQSASCGRRECRACDENITCKKTETAASFVGRCVDGTCAAVRR